MDDKLEQPNPELHQFVALIGIALELKYGRIDQLLTLASEQGGISGDKIKDIDQQITQIKEQMGKLEEMLKAIDEIMPKLTVALASNQDDPVCSDSDPRKVQFFRLWDEPLVVVEEWQRLSKSFSKKEKAAFVERMLLIIEQLDLFRLGLSDLYPRPTS
jgi:hypothetical protein